MRYTFKGNLEFEAESFSEAWELLIEYVTRCWHQYLDPDIEQTSHQLVTAGELKGGRTSWFDKMLTYPKVREAFDAEIEGDPLNQLWTAFGRPHPFTDTDVLAILSNVLKEFVAAQEALPADTDADTLAEGIKGMVERIAELKTIKEAPLHESWKTAPREKLLDGLRFQGAMTRALTERQDVLIPLLRDVPVEHLHGELVTVCRDDCPGCAWEKKRAALGY